MAEEFCDACENVRLWSFVIQSLAGQSCVDGEICIGQIFNSELGHSFLVGNAGDGRFVCFDKAGFVENPLKNNKDFSFRVYEIGKLLENKNYQDSKWRFVPIADI